MLLRDTEIPRTGLSLMSEDPPYPLNPEITHYFEKSHSKTALVLATAEKQNLPRSKY